MTEEPPEAPDAETSADEDEQWSKEDYDDWVVTMMDAAATWSGEDDLYHYTSIDGLLGILQSGRLWGTHVAFLNDSQELEYGIETICKVLTDAGDRLLASESDDTSIEPDLTNGGLLKRVGSFIQQNSDMLKPNLGPFVSCLSISGDQLSQWRGYGKAGWYALRFDPEKLDSVTHVNSEGERVRGADPVLVKVRYRAAFEDDILQMAYAYVEDMVNLRELEREDEKEDARGRAWVDLFSKVLEIARQIKHRSFMEEREYRIITRGNEQFYTPSKIGLIPRVLVQFDSGAVKEVMVGPGEFSDLRKLSLERYLDRNRDRYPDVNVTLSQVPYREL
jgi:hypothetical protein